MKIHNILEVRYQPHGEISRKYAVYDPKTGLFPYTVMGLGVPKPKTSDTYNTADEARERIKEFHDQAVEFLRRNQEDYPDTDKKLLRKVEAVIDNTQYYKVVEMIVRYAK